MFHSSNQSGLSILTSVIVIMSVALSIAVTVALLGTTDLETTYLANQGELLRASSDSCVEETIYKLKKSSSYEGEEISFFEGAGKCEIEIEKEENNYLVTVKTTLEEFERNIRFTGTPRKSSSGSVTHIKISNWEEF